MSTSVDQARIPFQNCFGLETLPPRKAIDVPARLLLPNTFPLKLILPNTGPGFSPRRKTDLLTSVGTKEAVVMAAMTEPLPPGEGSHVFS